MTQQAGDDYPSDISTTGLLSTGGSASGTITDYNDHDWFRMPLDALGFYRFTVQGKEERYETLRSFDPSRADDYYNHGLSYLSWTSDGGYLYQPVRTGDYYLDVSAYGYDSYIVNLIKLAQDDYGHGAAAGQLTPDAPRAGAIQIADDKDDFTFNVQAGHSYLFELASSFVSVDGRASLMFNYDAPGQGSVNYSQNGKTTASLTATADGTATVTVEALDQGTGSYVLTEHEITGDVLGSAATTAKLAPGTSLDGRFETAMDRDWYAIQVTAGTSYTVTFKPEMSGLGQLRVVDAAGRILTSADGSISGTAISAVWTAGTSGTEFVALDGSSFPGNYTLDMHVTAADDHPADSSTDGVWNLNGVTAGARETRLDVDWYKATLEANGSYVMSITTPDPVAARLEPERDLVVYDVSGHEYQLHSPRIGDYSTALFVPPASGTYYLAVRGNFTDVSSYTVTTAAYGPGIDPYPNNTSTPGILGAGALMHSAIDYAGDQDWFKLAATAGKAYTIELAGFEGQGGTLLRPDLELRSSTGELVDPYSWAADQHSFSTALTFYPRTTDTYTVVVKGQGTGTYTLSMPPQPDTLAPQLMHIQPLQSRNAVVTSIALSFDGPVTRGSGDIILKTPSGEIVERISPGTDPTDMALNLKMPLIFGADYLIEIPGGAFIDGAGHPYAAAQTFVFNSGYGIDVHGDASGIYEAGAITMHNGGAGRDALTVAHAASDYAIHRNGELVTLVPSGGSGNAVKVTGFERLIFTDKAVAIDIDGNGGEVYRLYQAAFDRTPDLTGFGYWLDTSDRGASLRAIAASFINSAEFIRLYGANPTNADFAMALYHNTLHRAPDADGYAYWVHTLDIGASREDVLISFSESPENQAAVLPHIVDGMIYTPWL